MDAKLRYPGMPNIWWMPIQTRTEMLATGMRSQLGVKVFGADLATIERAAHRDRARARRRSRARAAPSPSASTGGFYLDVADRPRGAPRATALRVARRERGRRDGDRRARRLADRRGPRALPDQGALRARLPRRPRRARARARRDARRRAGAARAGRRRRASRSGPPSCAARPAGWSGFVFVDVGERPIVDYVARGARAPSREQVALPAGVRLEWAGQFQHYERAQRAARAGRAADAAARRAAALRRTRGSAVETGDRAARGAVLADRRGLAALRCSTTT